MEVIWVLQVSQLSASALNLSFLVKEVREREIQYEWEDAGPMMDNSIVVVVVVTGVVVVAVISDWIDGCAGGTCNMGCGMPNVIEGWFIMDMNNSRSSRSKRQGLITFHRMMNMWDDLELEQWSPLWGSGMRILLLFPLYYFNLYTINVYLRFLSHALVHAGEAELGLLIFILMDCCCTPIQVIGANR